MNNQRNINTGGGNYYENIQGIYVEGNYIDSRTEQNFINLQADFQQTATHIQELSNVLLSRGYNPLEAQKKIAQTLVSTVKREPSLKTRLIGLGKYLSNAAASGLVGEIAVEAVKLALSALV